MIRYVTTRDPIPRAAAHDAAVAAASILARRPDMVLVYVYGSTADARRPSVRDVDLALLTDRPLDADDLMRLRAELVAALRVDVDLVSLNAAPIVLAHEIVENGECLYARTPDVETDFVVRARARYWDFKPLLDAQWRMIGERLEDRRCGPQS